MCGRAVCPYCWPRGLGPTAAWLRLEPDSALSDPDLETLPSPVSTVSVQRASSLGGHYGGGLAVWAAFGSGEQSWKLNVVCADPEAQSCCGWGRPFPKSLAAAGSFQHYLALTVDLPIDPLEPPDHLIRAGTDTRRLKKLKLYTLKDVALLEKGIGVKPVANDGLESRPAVFRARFGGQKPYSQTNENGVQPLSHKKEKNLSKIHFFLKDWWQTVKRCLYRAVEKADAAWGIRIYLALGCMNIYIFPAFCHKFHSNTLI